MNVRSGSAWKFLFIFITTATCCLFRFSHAAESLETGNHRPIDPSGISGSLIIAGGGELTQSTMDRFMELAGEHNAKLVVIPTASQRADDSNIDFSQAWRSYQPENITVLHTRDREVSNQEEFVTPLKNATAAWISGGSQSRLADAYVDTNVERELHALLKRGGVIGGTSAGAAIMSRHMIASGSDQPEIRTGLGLLPGIIIDQHFLTRRRQLRSTVAIRDYPDHVGMGIDEATAVEVSGRTIQVLGESVTTFMLAGCSHRKPLQFQLSKGQKADLTALRRAAIARAGQAFPPAEIHIPRVAKGSLLIVGGGGVTQAIADRFVQLAGGAKANIVILPTAGDDASARRARVPSFLSNAKVNSIRILPQRRPNEIESPEFQQALRQATGVWFGGGRQWRFIDAYENTTAEYLFRDVLLRGGVIGGSSAGASIQAEYMVRGNPLGNQDMMAEGYERGLNFLPGVAIDQHLTQRGRLNDLRSVVERFPQLLGIGIDENTAIAVQGSRAEVIGDNNVYFLDRQTSAENCLNSGEFYDMEQRQRLPEVSK